MSRRVIEHIVEQHAEDAAFLWLQRDRAVDAPDQYLKNLSRLDDRLEAHIDGLRVSDEWGWQVAERAFDQYQEPGETFVAAVLAFESLSENRIGYVLNLAEASPDLFRATVSALGWVEPYRIQEWIRSLLGDPRPIRRLLGLAACSVRRIDPAMRLSELLNDTPAVRARALRLAGEVGRVDLLSDIKAALNDPHETCRFWAAWSCVLLGDRHEALEILRRHASVDGIGWKGVQLLLRAAEHQSAVQWLLSLCGDRSKERLIAAGSGILGDPIFVPWLTTRMRDPKLARLAGESFETITGMSIEREGMHIKSPADVDFENASPADYFAREEALVWPDVRKIREWWRRNQTDFSQGRRYLQGKPLAAASLAEIFANGTLRQRRCAALDLALSAPDAPLANSSARSLKRLAPAGSDSTVVL
ncbi:TIGR02270 family protein [Mesorhizobium sp.]|uniref:TIGR02270 family protein n=1 Tax=Mesorhizobium sp. TaxID=1871066 RepID=UPI000FEA2DC8|nr:TIGR02270 family protein [Mesorhizobium sp.]RWL17618.1 MAG: TIGR02270 family protein [Mesorhizobium sp.]RWM75746.1 MAG: TIGR02270 family protein [Mesorhizobium sp.]TIO22721.1 MAG: TIGR02270 family protein [Mesorhizobium sp.]TJV58848.1 MAG: TIGR02270 family protein [Mesorhizobium sp.]